jgi:hypothetical protein
MKSRLTQALIPLVLLALILPACAPTPVVTPFVANTPTVTPLATPTPVVRSLKVCLGEEPNTLYPYGNLNSAARSVLSAIYDGPMDVVDYTYEPIILEKIPTLEDGDAQISPVSVTAGTGWWIRPVTLCCWIPELESARAAAAAMTAPSPTMAPALYKWINWWRPSPCWKG